jgi:signal peptidase I
LTGGRREQTWFLYLKMKLTTSQSSILASFSLFLFFFIFWMTLAPAHFGGPATYVIVDGNSMEPRFHRGDLLLVRAEPAYGVGDAVVYQNAEMGSYVFHRIIGTELDRFILQGDNNSWLDSYKPGADEIVGKLWLRIPGLGKSIEWMRFPLHMAVTVGVLGVFLMFDMFKNPSQQKKQGSAPLGKFGGMPEIAVYAFGILALFFLATGVYAFTRPLSRPAENVPYKQEAQFVYSATGTPGVYDTDVVRAGEPVFPKLTCFLNIGFTYNVSGANLQGVSGTHRMYARILDEQSGWQRTIPLSGEIPFSGNSFFNTTTLDLCQVESLVNLVEGQAGLKQVVYTLEIVTEASFTANVDGILVSDSFSPVLLFKYNKVHFYIAAADGQADLLYSSKQGLAGSVEQKPNSILMLGLPIPVWIIRFASLLGFGLSIYGLISAGLSLYRTASQSQEALIRLKYGGMLVDVYEQSLPQSSSIVDVASMDDLGRLAERHGTMILHMTRNFLQYYFVQSGSITYRYVISTGRKGIPEPETPSRQPEPLPQYAVQEPVFTAPAPIPAPLPMETSVQDEIGQEQRTVYVYMPSRDETQPVFTGEYDTVQTPAQESVHDDPIEYVIKTGEIEFSMPQDTTMLKRIKL